MRGLNKFNWIVILTIGLMLSTALSADRMSTRAYPERLMNAQQKAFISKLTILVGRKNNSIKRIRLKVESIERLLLQGKTLTIKQIDFLQTLAVKYRLKRAVVKTPAELFSVCKQLLMRINILPQSLVLAQSINETNWGRSRFAKQGNNYFGMWCYRKGCGIVPKRRPPGAKYEVQKFTTVKKSLNRYYLTLNSYRSYADLRKIRQQLSKDHLPITGLALAEGLRHYSTRRDAYVKSLQRLIKTYSLDRFYVGKKIFKDD